MMFSNLNVFSLLVIFATSFGLSGCKQAIKSRFVVQPEIPLEIGDPVYLNGQVIGKVSNLAMDANDCYADVLFVDVSSRDRYSMLTLTVEGEQLVLVESIENQGNKNADGFRW
jgi:hypothetical protein